MKDLKHVRALLFSIRQKWYDIGIKLNLDAAELDIIRGKYDDPADCLLEMLKLWLRSIKGPMPTQSILADALRAEAVNEVALAEGIAKNTTIEARTLRSMHLNSVLQVQLP